MDAGFFEIDLTSASISVRRDNTRGSVVGKSVGSRSLMSEIKGMMCSGICSKEIALVVAHGTTHVNVPQGKRKRVDDAIY